MVSSGGSLDRDCHWWRTPDLSQSGCWYNGTGAFMAIHVEGGSGPS